MTAALLVVTLVVVEHLPHERRAAPAPPRVPVSLPTPQPVTGAANEAVGIGGRTLSWDGSLRLPVTGSRPAWFWPATGQARLIGGLPADGSGYQFVQITGGWAIQANPGVQSGCDSCAGPPLPVYFLADGAQSVIQVGTADEIAPGTAARSMWLVSYPADADMSTTAATAQEVSGSGAQIRSPLRLPIGDVIDQATDRGLLLAPAVQQAGPATYTLWNPAGPPGGRSFTGVVAASPSEIAWAPPCDPHCSVDVLNLATGRQIAVELPGASSAANAAFSPSGSLLAVQVSFYDSDDDGALAMQLDVASVATGRLTVVPGTYVSSDAMDGFGWPAGGDSLVAELTFTTKVQLTSWHPGALRLAVAVVREPQISASLIVG